MVSPAYALQAVQRGFDPYAAHQDTGWFGSALVKAVSKAAKAVGKVGSGVISGAAKGILTVANAPLALTAKGFNAVIPGSGKYINIANAPIKFVNKTAVGMAAGVAQGALATFTNPNIDNLCATAQNALKVMGPIGMVASGALGAMKAGLKGQGLEAMAWAAAEGAAPPGISAAINAAHALRNGSNVLKVALQVTQSGIIPGTQAMVGFNAGVAALKSQASMAGLGAVRNALGTEQGRRAFDMAVGTVAKVAKQTPALLQRAGAPNISIQGTVKKLSAMQPNLQSVVTAIKRNPGLLGTDVRVLANRFNTNTATINDAMRHVQGKTLLPWRSMSPSAIALVKRYNPNAPTIALRHRHTDIAGLDQSGLKYIVERGDGPWAIAQKLTGNGNRWKELLDVNKDKNPKVDKNVWVGEVLNLPLSWQKPLQVSAPTATTTNALPVPLPTLAPIPGAGTVNAPPTVDIVPSIIQAKSILVAWSKTDGINQSGVPDYGLNVLDLGTTLGPRDTLQLQSFQNWDNRTLGGKLKADGSLDPATLAALQAWAEGRATAAIPAKPPAPVFIPPEIITQTFPTTVGGTDSTTKPANTTPITPTPSVQPKAPGGSMGMVAGGALIGGLLFGIPGALAGAAGGAAIS